MRRRALALSIAAAVLPLTACTPSLHDIEVGHLMGESGKTLTAEFSDAGRLPLGAEVRFGAQVVGRVTDIEVHDFQAVVELSITDDTAVPEGTTARIELTSALGEEYVMLHPPAEPGPPLPDGARLENTSKGPDVEDALAALGAVVNGAGMDQARTVISEFNNAFDGRDQQLRELLEQLRSGLAALEAQSDQITEVIDDVHALSERLAAGKPTIERALTNTPRCWRCCWRSATGSPLCWGTPHDWPVLPINSPTSSTAPCAPRCGSCGRRWPSFAAPRKTWKPR